MVPDIEALAPSMRESRRPDLGSTAPVCQLGGDTQICSETECWPQVLSDRYRISPPHAEVVLWHLRRGGGDD